jgi:ABC-type Fe3+ transport system permease subunit
MSPEHGDLGRGRAACGLCLLALPVPRRQASVLLAADQPHGAAAVFALPFFQLYSAVGLFDTHLAVALAHCLFNIPLAVWILEGFMSGVPKELDETAYVDGYSFWRFFVKIFLPTIAAGIGVAAFFCFMFSWVELLAGQDPDRGRGQAHRRDHDPHRVASGL